MIGLLRVDVTDVVEVQSILVVDDDPRICRLLTRLLTPEGYKVETAPNGYIMWRALRARPFDLVILDLRLPGGEDGLTLARRLCSESDVSLIMLTGKSDSIDKVIGLELGADDYITKPFDRRELLARIRSVLRRSGAQQIGAAIPEPESSVLRFSGWTLDLGQRETISPEGARVELTFYEFELLSILAQRPRRALSRDQILELIANRHWQPYDRSIDVLIGKLRRKLQDDSRNPRLIKTVRGIGYMFTPLTATE
jgi:two-component system, OmpR family, response regulator